jgi:hypothetical protein
MVCLVLWIWIATTQHKIDEMPMNGGLWKAGLIISWAGAHLSLFILWGRKTDLVTNDPLWLMLLLLLHTKSSSSFAGILYLLEWNCSGPLHTYLPEYPPAENIKHVCGLACRLCARLLLKKEIKKICDLPDKRTPSGSYIAEISNRGQIWTRRILDHEFHFKQLSFRGTNLRQRDNQTHLKKIVLAFYPETNGQPKRKRKEQNHPFFSFFGVKTPT